MGAVTVGYALLVLSSPEVMTDAVGLSQGTADPGLALLTRAMLMCDQGERYMHSYYDDAWVERTLGLDTEPYTRALEGFLSSGRWNEPASDAVPAARNA